MPNACDANDAIDIDENSFYGAEQISDSLPSIVHTMMMIDDDASTVYYNTEQLLLYSI